MRAAEDNHRGLEERIEQLERQNRSWKIGGIAAIAALAVSLTASAWAQQHNERAFRAQTVESEHFILKNAGGQTEGELTVTPQGPVLNLYGAGGQIVWSTKGGTRPASD
jgi:hypothetical protein